MKFILKNRDFTDMPAPPALNFVVERFSNAAVGGCKQATITATGSRADLWALLNHMRDPVEIYTDRGDLVWWGYLANVAMDGAIGFGCDIASMFNRVAVAFTNQNIRFTTDWSEDADSVAEYGKKEILLSASEISETTALGFRDTSLAAKKIPIPITAIGGEEEKATITCLGWFYTLDWQYYSNATGKESYEALANTGREIGEDDRPIMAQSIQLASSTAWPASSVWLNLWKVGTPSDNLIVSLYSDDGGEPGTSLASCTMAGADIGSNSEWVEFPLSSTVTLNPATTYWIHIHRSGAVDPNNYYMISANIAAGYPRGAIKLYNTELGSWTSEPGLPSGDMNFKVVGNTETTEQIESLITTAGQFFAGAIIETESGINSQAYRDGDTPALYELLKLLAAGTTNYRRLLCEVTPNRYLRVYEEDARPADLLTSYGLTKDGQLVNPVLTPVDPENCMVGIWCHLVDVIPPTVDLSIVADPSLFFIEEAEFDAIEGKYNILLNRDQEDIFSFGGTTQG